MIARVWSARATPMQSLEYLEHLRSHVLPVVREVDGYAGATLLQREVSGEVEIVVTTWWWSLDAIRAFAGDDQEADVVAGEAASMLSQFNQRFRHYDLVVQDEV
ncbi:hypothetical protein BH23CHL1_BH23CHL1_13850 [soil metagenome]